MAQNITLLGASYTAVPAVLLPKTGGGTAQFDDTTDANAVAADIAQGKTAYVNGTKITGTGSGGGTYSLTNIVPTQTIATTTSNMYGYVGLIPSYSAYVQPDEWYLVTYDNTEYVVTGYYGANSEVLVGDYQLITSNVEWLETPFMVEHNLTNGYFFLGSRVSGNHTLKVDKITFLADGVTLQTKTHILPKTSTQTITADSGYDGLESVQIDAMPSGTAGTPIAAKSAVSNHSVNVIPTVQNYAGYIQDSLIQGTSVTVSAYELVSGSQTITTNNTYDVTNLASVVVNVSSGGSVSYDTKTETASNYPVSIQFTSMKGEPKAFVCRLNAQVSSSGNTTYYYIVDVSAFGTTTHGNCFRIGGTRRVDNITSGYSWSYSGTTLTITSSASSRSASPGAFYSGSYELLYAY